MRYQFIEQHKQDFPVVVMCRVLAVSESGYYAWRKRLPCQRSREDAQLTQEIQQVFERHQGRYGSPRISRELKDGGRKIARKRVARLMREADLSARSLSPSSSDHQTRCHPSGCSQSFKSGVYEPQRRKPNGSQISRLCAPHRRVFDPSRREEKVKAKDFWGAPKEA
jgi:putative transposase